MLSYDKIIRILYLYLCTEKNLKIRTPETLAVLTLKFKQNSFDKGVMHPKDADGMAYSADPDQDAPLGAVWSGSLLFAWTFLSQNFESIRYYWIYWKCWRKNALQSLTIYLLLS